MLSIITVTVKTTRSFTLSKKSMLARAGSKIMRLYLAVPGTDASRALLSSARLRPALEYGRACIPLHIICNLETCMVD